MLDKGRLSKKITSILTIPLGHCLNNLAPLSRYFGERLHSEPVDRAAVERRHVFGGLVPVVCVHPGVRAPLASWLILDDVFIDASIGIFRGLPPQLDGRHRQRQGLDVAWG